MKVNYQEYQKSLSLTLDVSFISDTTKETAHAITRSGKANQGSLFLLALFICKDLEIKCPEIVTYSGHVPHKRRENRLCAQLFGWYKPAKLHLHVYKFTAVQKKERATKSVLNVFIHEMTHHIDNVKFGMPQSPHTKGFYRRMRQLENALK